MIARRPPLVFFNASNIYQANDDGTNAQSCSRCRARLSCPASLRMEPVFASRSNGPRTTLTRSGKFVRTAAIFIPYCRDGITRPANAVVHGRRTAATIFFLNSTTSGANVWVMREPAGPFHRHSSAPFQLTTGPLSFESLLPSADGKKLFVSALQGRGELVRYDPNPSNSCRFLRGYRRANWSSRVTASGSPNVSYPDRTLWRSRVDGSDRLRLTYPPVLAGLLALVSRCYPDCLRS